MRPRRGCLRRRLRRRAPGPAGGGTASARRERRRARTRVAPFVAGAVPPGTHALREGSGGCSLLVHLDAKRDDIYVHFGSGGCCEFPQPTATASQSRANCADRDIQGGSRVFVREATPVAQRDDVLFTAR